MNKFSKVLWVMCACLNVALLLIFLFGIAISKNVMQEISAAVMTLAFASICFFGISAIDKAISNGSK